MGGRGGEFPTNFRQEGVFRDRLPRRGNADLLQKDTQTSDASLVRPSRRWSAWTIANQRRVGGLGEIVLEEDEAGALQRTEEKLACGVNVSCRRLCRVGFVLARMGRRRGPVHLLVREEFERGNFKEIGSLLITEQGSSRKNLFVPADLPGAAQIEKVAGGSLMLEIVARNDIIRQT